MAYNYRRISQLSSTSYANVTSDKMVILTDVVSGPVLQTIPVLNLSQSIQNFINSNPVVSTLIVSAGTPSTFVANSTANYLANTYVKFLSVNSAFLANSSGTITSNANIERLSVNNFINVHTFSNNILVVNNSGTYVNTIYISDGGAPNTYINATSVNSKDMTLTGDLVVAGNVTLSGQTTFVNSSVITTKDKYIIFSNNAATSLAADGSGILIGQYANLTYSDTYTGFQSNVNIVPYSNNVNLGNPARLWNVYANNVNAVSYTVGTIFVANSSVLLSNGFVVNSTGAYVTGLVNATSYNVGTNFIANTLGVYTIGTVNAASHTVGTVVVANTTTLNANGFVVNSTGAYVTGTVNAASHTIGTTFIANTTGAYHTGTVNAASHTTGATGTGTGGLIANVTTLFIGNNTINTSITSAGLVVNNAVTVNSTGLFTGSSTDTTTGTGALIANDTILFVGNNTVNAFLNTTGLSINATTIANTLGVYTTGSVNAASHTVGTSVIANTSGIYTTGTVNAASHTTGGGYGTVTGGSTVNTTVVSIGNSSVNAFVNTSVLYIGGNVIANSTGANNAFNLNGVAASSYVNTSGNYTISGVHTHTANVSVNGAIIANGGAGTSGQVLTSSAGGNVYWSTVSGGGGGSVNTDSTYAWTNTQTFSNTITFNGSILANTINAASYTVGTSVIANTSGVYTTGTVNAVSYTVGSSFVANSSQLLIGTAVGVNANGSVGSSGQVLTSNGTTVYWSTASGGTSATLVANTTDTQTYYLPMSNTISGSWTNAVVSNTSLYFVPSTGTLSATVFNSLSDLTQKTNIQPILNPLKIIQQLRGVEFDWIKTNKKSAGVIAQELEQILPHLVEENNGVKSVNYSGLIAYLIETINQLDSEMDDLKSRISDLEKRS